MSQPTPLLIETMHVSPDGHIALLPYHLQRLKQSATDLAYPYDEPAVGEAIKQLTATLGSTPHRLRLTLSAQGELKLEHAPLQPTPEPVNILISLDTLAYNPWLRHKTTNRLWYDAASALLTQHPQLFDVVFFNAKGELCEGSRSNVYIQRDGQWYTPPLECGLLGGVKRAQLLDAQQVRVATISRADFEAASAIRVSNALRGWLDAQLITLDTLKQG